MSNEEKVREASNRFYAGLTRMLDGDLSEIDESWSHDSSATTMHPIGGREVGWDAVRNSFAAFSQAASKGTVTLKDQIVRVVGDVAYELGTETGQFGLGDKQLTLNQRVTNIYQREGDQWKLIHHHADTSPSMIEVLKSLQ